MLKYIGNGAFIPGIPARDLTYEEAKAYGGRLRLIRSGLYRDTRPSRIVKMSSGPGENKAIIPEEENK